MSNKHNKGQDFFGKQGFYVRVKGKGIDSAMRTLRNVMKKEGWAKDIKRQEYYLSPGQKRRRDKEEAIKRWQERLEELKLEGKID